MVRYQKTAYKMMEMIKRMFLGGRIAESSKLIEKLSHLRFQGNYFTFLSGYQSTVTQLLAVDKRTTGYSVLTMQFLNKLPRMLSSQTHVLKQEIEAAEDDSVEIWNNAFSKIQDYLVDSGLIDLSKKNNEGKFRNGYRNPTSFISRRNNKKEIECWNCGEKGHYKSQCTHPRKTDNKSAEKR